jgi:hypothetical protein
MTKWAKQLCFNHVSGAEVYIQKIFILYVPQQLYSINVDTQKEYQWKL